MLHAVPSATGERCGTVPFADDLSRGSSLYLPSERGPRGSKEIEGYVTHGKVLPHMLPQMFWHTLVTSLIAFCSGSKPES